MLERLEVNYENKKIYDIVLEKDFSSLLVELKKLNCETKKICIVSDSNVAPLYLDAVREEIIDGCTSLDTFIFEAGEENKNLEIVQDLYRYLIEKKYDRNDWLIALGGGVVGDLCGYTAATYLRGIDFIQIPTTLLSQVDSSVGGKTGVDFDCYKNMVGAFHMPKLVYTNIATISTLSDEQFSSGMGEVIKHGLIRSESYYQWIVEHRQQILNRELLTCASMIYESIKIKKQVVENDPKENGERALLNFGHTLGHAIEKLSNFQLPHGQCVSLGIVAALALSQHRKKIDENVRKEICEVLRYFDLPIQLDTKKISKELIIEASKNDKKMIAGKIKFILLNSVGDAYIDSSVCDDEMLNALEVLYLERINE